MKKTIFTMAFLSVLSIQQAYANPSCRESSIIAIKNIGSSIDPSYSSNTYSAVEQISKIAISCHDKVVSEVAVDVLAKGIDPSYTSSSYSAIEGIYNVVKDLPLDSVKGKAINSLVDCLNPSYSSVYDVCTSTIGSIGELSGSKEAQSYREPIDLSCDLKVETVVTNTKKVSESTSSSHSSTVEESSDSKYKYNHRSGTQSQASDQVEVTHKEVSNSVYQRNICAKINSCYSRINQDLIMNTPDLNSREYTLVQAKLSELIGLDISNGCNSQND